LVFYGGQEFTENAGLKFERWNSQDWNMQDGNPQDWNYEDVRAFCLPAILIDVLL
jgi:hypothetical protein